MVEVCRCRSVHERQAANGHQGCRGSYAVLAETTDGRYDTLYLLGVSLMFTRPLLAAQACRFVPVLLLKVVLSG